MDKVANINVRTNIALKKEAELLFEELGINMSTAINMFLSQSVRSQSIPFEITKEIPNKETIKAMKEASKIVKDSSVPSYKNTKEMFNNI
ncbi:MAG TPA: type II toxin-antitoxin system RelB/DinJ family antitoxin [Bacilli bacterium]|nr:type II toxin-antitoxin system RelB/DinJ family antitoxin [Bacilli bacterium]